MKKVAALSGEFMLLWVFSNLFYNWGLVSTSVSSSAVLCNTSSIFVYIFSIFFIQDVKFDSIRALMVIASILGIVVITINDMASKTPDGRNDTFIGNLLSLLSAVFYGAYAVIFKRRVPETEEAEF